MFHCCYVSESHPYVQAVSELTELWSQRSRYVILHTQLHTTCIGGVGGGGGPGGGGSSQECRKKR